MYFYYVFKKYTNGCFVRMYVCMPHPSSNHRGHKRGSDPLELEFKQLEVTMWVNGIKSVYFGRAADILHWRTMSPTPHIELLIEAVRQKFLVHHVLV